MSTNPTEGRLSALRHPDLRRYLSARFIVSGSFACFRSAGSTANAVADTVSAIANAASRVKRRGVLH